MEGNERGGWGRGRQLREALAGGDFRSPLAQGPEPIAVTWGASVAAERLMCKSEDPPPHPHHLSEPPSYATRNLVLSEETPLRFLSSYKLCDLT